MCPDTHHASRITHHASRWAAALLFSCGIALHAQETPESFDFGPTADSPESAGPQRPLLLPQSRDLAKKNLLNWLENAYPGDADRKAAVEKLWAEDQPVPQLVVGAFEKTDAFAAALLEACRKGDYDSAKAAAEKSLKTASNPFFKTNLGQAYARFLVKGKRYDDALDLLSVLTVEDSALPAEVFFLRAVAESMLLRRDDAMKTLERLRKETPPVPERYHAIAELLEIEMASLNEESLDQISRMMGDVERRLTLRDVGAKVQDEEKDIVARLDKLIEKLENQGGGGGASGSGSNSTRSRSPASDSRIMGGKGPGKVDDRSLSGRSDWARLPEKEREKMLQEMGRQFPAHYREVIEEYFRKLAEEPKADKSPK